MYANAIREEFGDCVRVAVYPGQTGDFKVLVAGKVLLECVCQPRSCCVAIALFCVLSLHCLLNQALLDCPSPLQLSHGCKQLHEPEHARRSLTRRQAEAFPLGRRSKQGCHSHSCTSSAVFVVLRRYWQVRQQRRRVPLSFEGDSGPGGHRGRRGRRAAAAQADAPKLRCWTS